MARLISPTIWISLPASLLVADLPYHFCAQTPCAKSPLGTGGWAFPTREAPPGRVLRFGGALFALRTVVVGLEHQGRIFVVTLPPRRV